MKLRPDVLFLPLCLVGLLSGQTPLRFERQNGVYLPGAGQADAARSVALGDVDGDGTIDMFFGRGCQQSDRLWLASPAGPFRDVSGTHLPLDVEETIRAEFVDVDGDGDLDLVSSRAPRLDAVAGRWVGGIGLLVNNGQGRFTDVTATQMPGALVHAMAIAVGDVDRDGDPDLVLGCTPSAARRPPFSVTGQTRLYLNDGAGRFSDATSGNLPVDNDRCSDLVVEDMDRDGDLDVVITLGRNAVPGRRQLRVLSGNGRGGFTDVTNSAVTYPVPYSEILGSLTVFDANGDGHLDVYCTGVVTEQVAGRLISSRDRLLLGRGSGALADASARLPRTTVQWYDQILHLAAAAVDVDRDGDLDLLLGRYPKNSVLINDGQARFSSGGAAHPISGWWNETRQNFVPGGCRDKAAWMDLKVADLDRDGREDAVMVTPFDKKVYLGDGRGFLEATGDGPSMRAHQAVAIDVDNDGDLDLLHGHRRQDGRQLRLFINHGKTGFHEETGRLPDLNKPDRTQGVALWISAGDLDGDGDTDFIATINYDMRPVHGNHFRVFLNDGRGFFSLAPEMSLRVSQPVAQHVLADVDLDGDLDLIGATVSLVVLPTQLFLNDGRGQFTDVSATHMPATGSSTNAIALADVDRDGDPDLLLANTDSAINVNTGQNHLYLNDGTGRFTDATSRLPVLDDRTGGLTVGDFDGDGNLDIYFANFAGAPPVRDPQDRIFRGDGRGNFADVTASWLPSSPYDSLVPQAADVDLDGDLDLVVGSPSGNRLLLGDGRGSFVDATPALPVDSANGKILVEDFDGDGDADFFSGNTRNLQLQLTTYRFERRTALFYNMDRQIRARSYAYIGRPLTVDVFYKAGYGTNTALFVPFVSATPAHVRVPGLGTIELDPALSVPLPPKTVTPAAGRETLTVQVPQSASLVGIPVLFQMLVIEPGKVSLTNCIRDRIR